MVEGETDVVDEYHVVCNAIFWITMNSGEGHAELNSASTRPRIRVVYLRVNIGICNCVMLFLSFDFVHTVDMRDGQISKMVVGFFTKMNRICR